MRPTFHPNPPKRTLSALDHYEQVAWADKIANQPERVRADVASRPDLHQHVFLTELGPLQYDHFNPVQYWTQKALYRPADLLYQGPEYPPLEEEEEQEKPQRAIVDDHGSIDMPDAPDSPHVTFTPHNALWRPLAPVQNLQGVPAKPTLKRQVAAYEELGPNDKEPVSPFLWDTSGFIEEEERKAKSVFAPYMNNALAGHTPARLPPQIQQTSPFNSSSPFMSRPIRKLDLSTPYKGPSLLRTDRLYGKYGKQPEGISKGYSPTKKSQGQSKLHSMTFREQWDLCMREQGASQLASKGAASSEGNSPLYQRSSFVGLQDSSSIEPNYLPARERFVSSGRCVGITKEDLLPVQQRASLQQHTSTPPQQNVHQEQNTPSTEDQASPLQEQASPPQQGHEQNTPSAADQESPLQKQSSPPQQGSPSLKRASPSEEDTASTPQQHISPPRKIITPVRQRTRPSATELYPNLSIDPTVRYQQTTPAPEEINVRRIGGKFVQTLAERVGGFFANLYNNLYNRFFGDAQTEQTEVIAVATDMSDTKRRAVGRTVSQEKGTSTPSPQNGDIGVMPGQFADDTDSEEAAVTPQDDASTEKIDSPQAGNPNNGGGQRPEASKSAHKNQVSQTASLEQKNTKNNITPPDSRPASKQEEQPTQKPRYHQPDFREQVALMERRANGENVPWTLSYPNLVYRPNLTDNPAIDDDPLPTAGLALEAGRPFVKNRSKSRWEQNKAADTTVENLVSRAKTVALETPEERKVKARLRSNKQRVADEEIAKKREEEEKTAAEKAKIELEKEQEEIRQKLEAEAEELRQKEEQEAAEKAARAAIQDQLIRPLDAKWDERVAAAMSTNNGRQVLAKSTDGIELTRYMFGKILPQKDVDGNVVEKAMGDGSSRQIPGWLNDEAIDAFIATIVSRKLEQTGYVKGPKSIPSFAAYSTAWYKTYVDKGVSGLKTWSRRKGIQGEKLLGAERIFFPLNTGAHWVLLIISPKARKIEFLDSGAGKRDRFIQFAHHWLKMELGDKYDAEEWEEADSKSNKQLNFDDCGVFTCMNALASAKNKEFGEVPVTKGMDDARRMMVAVFLNGGFHGDWEL